MKLLDVFCGLGGVSDGFALEGFDVLGVDIEDMPAIGYKHKFLRADIRDLKVSDLPIEFRKPDVEWGSPPCRDYSRIATVGNGANRKDCKKWAWKIPPNPQEGLKNVTAYLRFVQETKPRFWVMENVLGLTKYLALKPRQISRIERTKVRAFWGNFPSFLMPLQEDNNLVKGLNSIQGKDRSWKRAKIPLACSRAFARAIRETLEERQFLEVSEK